MDSQPAITVGIPYYNSEKYVPRIFSSLANQTFKDFDILFVDDGSTDNTTNRIHQFAKTNNLQDRVHIITQENKKVAAARNTIIRNAKGRYIFFLDADDSLPDTALEALYKATNNEKRKIVNGRAKFVIRNIQPFPLVVQLLFSNVITGEQYVKFCMATL